MVSVFGGEALQSNSRISIVFQYLNLLGIGTISTNFNALLTLNSDMTLIVDSIKPELSKALERVSDCNVWVIPTTALSKAWSVLTKVKHERQFARLT